LAYNNTSGVGKGGTGTLKGGWQGSLDPLPGLWEIRVMQSNVRACQFWARAISMFTGEAVHPVLVKKGGEDWELYSFESKRVSQQ